MADLRIRPDRSSSDSDRDRRARRRDSREGQVYGGPRRSSRFSPARRSDELEPQAPPQEPADDEASSGAGLGENPAEQAFNDIISRNYTPEELKQLEENGGEAADDGENAGSQVAGHRRGTTVAEQGEAERLSHATGEPAPWVVNDIATESLGKGRKRTVFTRRRLIGGGIAGGAVGGTMVLFSIFSGPLQIIHFGQLLQQFHLAENEDFGDGRSTRYMRHLLLGSTAQGRIGFLGSKYAARWDARLLDKAGLKAAFTGPPNQRFVGYQVVDEAKAKPFLDEMERDDVRPRTEFVSASEPVDIHGNRLSGARVIDFSDNDFRSRRSLIRTATRGTGTNSAVARIASRTGIKRGGLDYSPIKNKIRRSTDNRLEYNRQVKADRARRNRTGVDPPNTVRPVAEVIENEDGTTTTDPEADNAVREANEVLDELGDVDLDAPDGGKPKLDIIKGRLAKSVGGGALAVGVLCSVRALGDEAENIQYANIILPMMRIGMSMVTMASQVMSGQRVNMDELGAISEDLYDEVSETSWVEARSIQAQLGQPLTGPDLPSSARPSKVGEKPVALRFIDEIPGIGNVCGVTDFLGGLPILKQVGQITSAAIDGALSIVGAPTTEEITSNIVDFLAGTAVEMSPAGALLGSEADIGTLLAANDQIIAMGGGELGPAQVTELKAESRRNRELENSQKSLYARLFDVYDANSVIASTARTMPRSPKQALASLIKAPASLVSSLISHVSAQEAEPYDYGVPVFGFSLEEQNDRRFENPFENAVIVEARLPELNAKYGECFSMTVTLEGDNGTRLNNGSAAKYHEIADNENCRDGSEDLLRYRFYLADAITAHSLACYEGEKTSCVMLGIEDSVLPAPSSSGTNTPPAPTALGTFVWPLADQNIPVTSCWGDNRTLNDPNYFHSGLDLPVSGGTNVLASAAGTVVFAGDSGGGLGKTLIIQHEGGLFSQYQHLQEYLVTIGAIVTQGQAVALSGNTGTGTGDGYHLHFNIQSSGTQQSRAANTLNPLDYLPATTRNMTSRKSYLNPTPQITTCVPSVIDARGWVVAG
jgi:hypothetical protein